MMLLLGGVIAGFALIFLLLKLDMRKVAGYAFLVDLVLTIVLGFIFAGTFAGMISGLLGGLILSAFLYAYIKMFGYDKLNFKMDGIKPRMNWTHHKGAFA